MFYFRKKSKNIVLGVVVMSLPYVADAQRRPSNISSPEVLADNSVIFRIKAPNATKAQVVGTWSRGFKPNEMIKDEIGFKYTYRENIGNHDWNSWRLYLSEFAPLCFK